MIQVNDQPETIAVYTWHLTKYQINDTPQGEYWLWDVELVNTEWLAVGCQGVNHLFVLPGTITMTLMMYMVSMVTRTMVSMVTRAIV